MLEYIKLFLRISEIEEQSLVKIESHSKTSTLAREFEAQFTQDLILDKHFPYTYSAEEEKRAAEHPVFLHPYTSTGTRYPKD